MFLDVPQKSERILNTFVRVLLFLLCIVIIKLLVVRLESESLLGRSWLEFKVGLLLLTLLFFLMRKRGIGWQAPFVAIEELFHFVCLHEEPFEFTDLLNEFIASSGQDIAVKDICNNRILISEQCIEPKSLTNRTLWLLFEEEINMEGPFDTLKLIFELFVLRSLDKLDLVNKNKEGLLANIWQEQEHILRLDATFKRHRLNHILDALFLLFVNFTARMIINFAEKLPRKLLL